MIFTLLFLRPNHTDIRRLFLFLCVGVTKGLSADQNGGSKEKKSLVVCFGEMLIDFVPTVGGVSLAEAPAFKKAPGGAPANVAVGISRLGGSAAFIGKVHIIYSYILFSFYQFFASFFSPSFDEPCFFSISV